MAEEVFTRQDFDGLVRKLEDVPLEQRERELLVAIFLVAGNLAVGRPVEDLGEPTVDRLRTQVRNAFFPGDTDEWAVTAPGPPRIGDPVYRLKSS
jgi:hypothetical protein